MIECTLCTSCWRKSSRRGKNSAKDDSAGRRDKDGVNAVLVGADEMDNPSESISSDDKLEIAATAKEVVLDHHIFDSDLGWKKSESMSHPTLRLVVSTSDSEFRCPLVVCFVEYS